ncbi:putative chorismate mutase [Gordonia otitidis NBRC 100426]|uniref:Chorismate mutase n=1 Tax=Gordonia otitidis (strain DSM 44809 / CCUG 52243 / JCM 12355 / NBRC 100426 / IFM 10032) TaxID=1108044 RepID=H5TLQ9_GORO1|nr:putative chorismate mutase [Gordonia otitidis NBRC 100426]
MARGKITPVSDASDDQTPAKTPDSSSGSSSVPFEKSIDLDYYQLDPSIEGLSDEIDDLRVEIDRLDAIILAAIKRRTAVSKKVGATRMASGGPRLVHSREVKVIDRFADLGQEGHTLAMLLLRLGRGPLGR